MEKYKIKITNDVEAKECSALMKELGYKEENKFSRFTSRDNFGIACSDGSFGYGPEGMTDEDDQELTFPQLRDLVVLKRNDSRDANVNQGGEIPCLYDLYLTADKELYFYHCGKGKWLLSNLNHDEDYYATLKPVEKPEPQDPALISGAEALRALADGKDVQVSTEFTISSWHDDTATYSAEEILAEETAETDDYNSMKLFFRLKPQTIKVELELPKPFEPKNGEDFYYLDCTSDNFGGWAKTSWRNIESDAFKNNTAFGAWRTEEEIKQVVEQLRKIRGTNS
ncbi:TPA: hypothetical protein ACNVU8_003325 [Acinetobacter baumannii]